MSADEFMEYLFFVRNKELDEMLYQRWIPMQDQFGFEEFKNILFKKEKSEEEILSETELILEMFNKNRGEISQPK